MIKLSDYVIERVAELGVRHVFMLPGGGCMHLVDAVGRCSSIEFVCCLHEQAAAIAAEAYGQYTNRPGVVLVTTGPGGTNAVTAVASAWLDSTPMLVISGQVKRADLVGTRGVRQMGFQEIDIVSMVKPITKYAVLIQDAQSIRFEVEKALHLASSGRPGPVWIDIPLDLQAAMIEPEKLPGYQPPSDEPRQLQPLPEPVDRAIALLNQAERPVMLVGNGVRLAGAEAAWFQLTELLGIPVLTTWKAMDFLDEHHPLYAGRPGSIGQRGANFAQQNSDFFLSIGARLDFGQTGYDHQNFARAARKVIVDIDQAEIDKLGSVVDVGIRADAGGFIDAVLARRGSVTRRDRSAWLERVRGWRARYPVILPEYWAEPGRVNHYVLMDALSEALLPTDIVVPGSSGACSEATMQALRVKSGVRVFNSEGLGPMGFGLPAAIGGCLASGRRRTLSVDGDGGFVMNIQELETLRRLALPVKIFVLNNEGYASIRSTQNRYFDGRLVASGPSSGLTLPNVMRVAEAYGLRTLRIENHSQVRARVAEALAGDDPVIVEVLVPATQETKPRLLSRQLRSGGFVTKPMEDLYPFLPRDEFLENMLIAPLEEPSDE